MPIPDQDGAIRARWRYLVDVTLPETARLRSGWPVSLNHCFARILLDCACERPWRDMILPPAWRNAPVGVLERGLALGEAVIVGEADLRALNEKSLRMRGKLP